MARIGVFGGTFNPPHRGHLQAAEEVARALELDRVLFIPDREPPHKQVPDGTPDGRTRLELVQAAIGELPFAEADDMELRREGKSYTADTLRLLRDRFPDDTLYLITGTDMFLSLHQWYHPEEICRYAVIVGLRRTEGDRDGAFQAQKNRLEKQFGARVELVENRVLEISSSRVRRLLILGGAEKYVPEPVLSIIRTRGLYNTDQDYRNLPEEELRRVAVGLLKESRVNHVLGCADTARKLARLYGADETAAYRAGLLHDVTKAIDGEDQLLLVDKYDILISDFERSHPKLLHAKTGAYVAKYVFGESEEIQKAIFWHTTGKADMSLMEKIIYLADYMEPTRDFPGVEKLRELAWTDLNRAMLLAFTMCIEELVRENKNVCKDSREARDFIARELGEPVEEIPQQEE